LCKAVSNLPVGIAKSWKIGGEAPSSAQRIKRRLNMTPYLPPGIPVCDIPQQGPEMRSVPRLSAEAERALCCRWHDRHDRLAAHLLVRDSAPVIATIAAAYGRRYGMRADDLIGECYVGLMRALCRFDPDSGERFAAYAACRVHAAVQEFLLRKWLRLKLADRCGTASHVYPTAVHACTSAGA
jgi:DNA-directed RNA polymerase sigma subunit (sigma70/sigma32)